MEKIETDITKMKKAVIDLTAAGGSMFQDEIESIRAKAVTAIADAEQGARKEISEGNGWMVNFILGHKVTRYLAAFFLNVWALTENEIRINWLNTAFFVAALLLGYLVGHIWG